ncbi:MAG: hypothetical protein LUH07_08185 [Lachnospiraceae bacterium]|nr:hypothetical protein [Lachnospiraceae bacterium]
MRNCLLFTIVLPGWCRDFAAKGELCLETCILHDGVALLLIHEMSQEMLRNFGIMVNPTGGETKMNWYRNLYVGKTFQKKEKKIIHRLEQGKAIPRLYLILMRTDTERNQLEVVQQCFSEKEDLMSDSVIIVGIASGMTETKKLLVQITDTVYSETGTAELKNYLLTRWMDSL